MEGLGVLGRQTRKATQLLMLEGQESPWLDGVTGRKRKGVWSLRQTDSRQSEIRRILTEVYN